MHNRGAVTGGVNIRVAGSHVGACDEGAVGQLIHALQESGVGTNADGQNDHVGLHLAALCQDCGNVAVFSGKALDPLRQADPDAVLLKLRHSGLTEFIVKSGQHMVSRLHEGQRADFPQQTGLGQFQADVAAAHNDHVLLRAQRALQRRGLLQGLERENTRKVDARQRRHNGRRPGRHQQLVIGNRKGLPLAAAADGLLLPIHPFHLMVQAHVNALLPELFHRPDLHAVQIRVQIRNVVGHTAGAIGHGFGFFQNDDLGIRCLPLHAGGGAHAGGVAAQNDNLHFSSLRMTNTGRVYSAPSHHRSSTGRPQRSCAGSQSTRLVIIRAPSSRSTAATT